MRLHTDRGFFYILLFLISLACLHLTVHLSSGSLPQLGKYILGESKTPLAPAYGGFSFTYIARHISTRYFIYPALFFTFLIDHFNKEKWLKSITPKIMFITLCSISVVVTILAKPTLETHTIPFLVTIRFPEGSGFYIYAIITWIILVAVSYKFLGDRIPKHHALWITLLIFLSVEEVWEYSPFLWSLILYGAVGLANVPLQLSVSITIWKASPSFLLIYYAYKFGLKPSFPLISSLVVSIFFSLLLLVRTDLVFIGVCLRLFWACSYALIAYSFKQPKKLKVK